MIAIGTKVRSFVTGREGVVSSRYVEGSNDFLVEYPTDVPGGFESIAYGESEVGTEDDRRALIEIVED